jgi:hypothetical protein
MASATGSHPDTGSSVRPLPGSSTTIRAADGRCSSAPKLPLLTERGFATGVLDGASGCSVLPVLRNRDCQSHLVTPTDIADPIGAGWLALLIFPGR